MPSATLQLFSALLGGLSDHAVTVGLGGVDVLPLMRDVARVRGFEKLPYFYGAREIPLGAVLGRQIVALTGGAAFEPEALAANLSLVLGVRETVSSKVTLRPVGEDALLALGSMRALIDGELFFNQASIRAQVRTLPVETSAPDLVHRAWGLGQSSWAVSGALKIDAELVEGEDEAVHLEYEARPVAYWREPRFRATMPGEPFEIGCERSWLQIMVLAPERADTKAHPLWYQALEEGYTTSEKAVLALVLMPNLSLLAGLQGGPGANNVLGENLDAVFQGGHTGFSAWSEVAAKRLVDEWVAERGSLAGLATQAGIARLVCEAMPAFVEGVAVTTDKESSAQRSFGFAVAEWLGGLFTPDQESGAGFVRDLLRIREEGQNITMVARVGASTLNLALVLLDGNGNPVSEHVFH